MQSGNFYECRKFSIFFDVNTILIDVNNILKCLNLEYILVCSNDCYSQ